jgi:hypothetical protein
MKRMPLGLITFLIFQCLLFSQDKPSVEKEKEAIKQAALDYAEGYYEGNAGRMERALHPLLVKRGLVPSNSGSGSFLVLMNSEMLIEVTRLGSGNLSPDQRNISYKLLDCSDNIASAKIFTAKFCDYLHLAKVNDQWRIVNVLWRPPAQQTAADGEKELESIKKVLEQLRSNAAAKDASMAQSAIHPEVARRAYLPFRQGGKPLIQERNFETLVEHIRMGRAVPPKDQEMPAIAVLDVYEDIASVKITPAGYTDYVHLTKQNGQWRILNGLTGIRQSSAQQSK